MIPLFTLRLICGLAMMWCTASRNEITSGFFRIQMLLCLGLSVLLAVTVPQMQSAHPQVADELWWILFGLAMTLAGCSFLGSIFWTLERRLAGEWAARLIYVISICAVTWQTILTEVYGTLRNPGFPLLNALSAAGLTGGVIATMLLGHWYLTATGMKLTPFISYTWMLLGAVILRIAVVLAGLWLHPHQVAGVWEASMQVLRWAGLLGPLLLTLLTLRILRYRNTQSATGVLYAAAALVFLGEMAAVLLAGAQAIPSAV